MKLRTNLDAGGKYRLQNLVTPVSDSEAALYGQVNGSPWKIPVVVVELGHVPNQVGVIGIGGYANFAMGDRVLLAGQNDMRNNGIYVWNGENVPMTRAPDANVAWKLEQAMVSVRDGLYAGHTYRQVRRLADGLGLSTLEWVDQSAAPALRRVVNYVGDGASADFNIIHGLGSIDLFVAVYDMSVGMGMSNPYFTFAPYGYDSIDIDMQGTIYPQDGCKVVILG